MDPEEFDLERVIGEFADGRLSFSTITQLYEIGKALSEGRNADAEVEIARLFAGELGSLAGGTLAAELTPVIIELTLPLGPEAPVIAVAVVKFILEEFGGVVAGEAGAAFVRDLQNKQADGGSLAIDDILGFFSGYLSDRNIELGKTFKSPQNLDVCFAAGTQISMHGGGRKPIETIEIGDSVVSFDAEGRKKRGLVVNIFQNCSKQLLDLYGTLVTPDHLYLCSTGINSGCYLPIIDILRQDGTIEGSNGAARRASTNALVGSPEDQPIRVRLDTREQAAGVSGPVVGMVRTGTRFIMQNGLEVRIMDLIKAAGAFITGDGLVAAAPGATPQPLLWNLSDELPRPETYILQRSGLTMAEINEERQKNRPSSGEFSPSTVKQELLKAAGRN